MNRLLLGWLVVVSSALAGGSVVRADDATSTAPPARYSVVQDAAGVWWFQSPDGKKFFSLGISNVTPEPYQPKPGTEYYNPVPKEFNGQLKDWAGSVKSLLLGNNFNTLGAWSSNDIPAGDDLHTTPVLYVVGYEGTRCLSPLRPDFEEFVRTNLRETLAKLPNRAGIMGVFLDNEMPWYGKSGWDDIPTYTLLEQALELPATDVRRAAAVEFLKSRHPSAAELGEAYHRALAGWPQLDAAYLMRCTGPAAAADREQFTAMLAEKFYQTTTRIVREELPGLLILGTRIPGNAPDAVIRACGKCCDVVSLNHYLPTGKADERTMTRFWVLGGKPIMLTEFSWRARQNNSGNRNTRGAGTVVETQAERAAAYAGLVADLAGYPCVIGAHWFEFADQSPQGRFDGEDSNYGVVDIHNKPYAELLIAMKATNAKVPATHGAARREMPKELPGGKGVTYAPGQHPERPPTLDFLGDWIHEPEIWNAPDAKLSWKRDGSAIVLGYDAGAAYGAGINILGPKSAALGRGPQYAADLDGYTAFVLKVSAPNGIQLNIVLAEAGSAAASSPAFDTSAGDDGEAFVSVPLFVESTSQTFRIPIAELLKQKFHGNQGGASRIDMQAIRNVGVQISGEPRKGEVRIEAFSLER